MREESEERVAMLAGGGHPLCTFGLCLLSSMKATASASAYPCSITFRLPGTENRSKLLHRRLDITLRSLTMEAVGQQ